MSIDLRSYQNRALEQTRLNFHKRIGFQILSAPTGAGKTEMAFAMIDAALNANTRTAFICDRLSLDNAGGKAGGNSPFDGLINQGKAVADKGGAGNGGSRRISFRSSPSGTFPAYGIGFGLLRLIAVPARQRHSRKRRNAGCRAG